MRPSHQEKLGIQKIVGTRVGRGPAMAARLSLRLRKGALFARRLVIPVPRGSRLAGCEWALQAGGEHGLTGVVGRADCLGCELTPSAQPGSSCQEANATLGAWPSSCARVVQRVTVSARSPQDSLAARDANRSFPGWSRPTRRRSMPRRAPRYPWSLTSGPRGAGRAEWSRPCWMISPAGTPDG